MTLSKEGAQVPEQFEVADASDPEGMIKATQAALIGSISRFVEQLKTDMGGPGLTWDQIDFVLQEFGKREPKIVMQEHEI